MVLVTKGREENLPNTEEALLGVGFTGGGQLYSLPHQTSRVVLLHYLQHSRPPKRTCHISLSLSLCFSHAGVSFVSIGLVGLVHSMGFMDHSSWKIIWAEPKSLDQSSPFSSFDNLSFVCVFGFFFLFFFVLLKAQACMFVECAHYFSFSNFFSTDQHALLLLLYLLKFSTSLPSFIIIIFIYK